MYFGGIYDPVQNRWQRLTPQPFARFATTAVPIGDNRLFAWGAIGKAPKAGDAYELRNDAAILTLP